MVAGQYDGAATAEPRGKVKHLPFALDGDTHAFIRNVQGDGRLAGRRGLPRNLHLPARESMSAKAGTRLVARNF